MSHATKVKSISLLTLMVALALPLAAQQLTPCFVECHDAAMEREAGGMSWEKNNEKFLDCIDENC